MRDHRDARVPLPSLVLETGGIVSPGALRRRRHAAIDTYLFEDSRSRWTRARADQITKRSGPELPECVCCAQASQHLTCAHVSVLVVDKHHYAINHVQSPPAALTANSETPRSTAETKTPARTATSAERRGTLGEHDAHTPIMRPRRADVKSLHSTFDSPLSIVSHDRPFARIHQTGSSPSTASHGCCARQSASAPTSSSPSPTPTSAPNSANPPSGSSTRSKSAAAHPA